MALVRACRFCVRARNVRSQTAAGGITQRQAPVGAHAWLTGWADRHGSTCRRWHKRALRGDACCCWCSCMHMPRSLIDVDPCGTKRGSRQRTGAGPVLARRGACPCGAGATHVNSTHKNALLLRQSPSCIITRGRRKRRLAKLHSRRVAGWRLVHTMCHPSIHPLHASAPKGTQSLKPDSRQRQ
jgi:hypothetical protein